MLLHLKINKKSSFDWNQLKTSTQHKYNIRKYNKNGEFSPFHF